MEMGPHPKMNQTINIAPRFRVLTDDQIEQIYYAALEVMEETGGVVYEEEALELLREGGAVVKGNHVRIPVYMCELAMDSNPRKITLRGRNMKRSLKLQKDTVSFGTGSDQPFTYDRNTGKRRSTTYDDVYNFSKFVDYLDNYDFHMSHGIVTDVPNPQTYDRHQFMAMVEGCTKPLVITAVDREGLEDQWKMACMIQGGEDEFRVNPMFVVYAEPISPLKHGKQAVEKLLFCAEKGIPIMYTPCPSSGATAPATMAGMLVQALAETLMARVICHLKNPGTPLMMGGVTTVMDMAVASYSYGAPELSLSSAANTDISKWLGMLMFSTGGCTDSKVLDEQCSIECMTSLFYAYLSGANLIHDVGYLDSGITASLENLVLNEELIGMVKQLGKGINTDDDHMALDVIREVGPAGKFIDHDHTYKHWRHWFLPKLQDRSDWDTWNLNGKKTMLDRVNEKTREILDTYEPEPIEPKLHEELKAVVKAADKKYS